MGWVVYMHVLVYRKYKSKANFESQTESNDSHPSTSNTYSVKIRINQKLSPPAEE